MTENELQNLLKQYRVPRHIMAHMERVAAVADFIGRKLRKNGEKIDLKLLRQAALLHDIVKLCDFEELDLQSLDQTYTAEDVQFWSSLIKSCHKDGHVAAAFNILKDLGEDELALIVKKHRFGSLMDSDVEERPKTWEEKLLYYSDKRVMHDKVVPLSQRLEDGRKRYFPSGKIPKDDKLVEKALYKLEYEICEKAGLKPSDINETTI